MRNRIFVIVSVIGMVGVLLGGWFIGVSPQLAAAAADDQQRVTVDGQNEALRLVVAGLIADEKNLPALKSDLAALQRSIPRDADTSAFIEDINGIGVAAGVAVSSIVVADAQSYVAPAAPAPTVDPNADASADAAADPAAPVAIPVDPLVPSAVTNALVSSENFVLVPVTIQSKGTYEQVLNFASGVQNGSRLYLATSFRSETDEQAVTTGTLTGYIYVLLNQFDPTAAK